MPDPNPRTPRTANKKGWVLEPGDALYLPPRLAHHGVSQDEVRTNPRTGGVGGDDRWNASRALVPRLVEAVFGERCLRGVTAALVVCWALTGLEQTLRVWTVVVWAPAPLLPSLSLGTGDCGEWRHTGGAFGRKVGGSLGRRVNGG